MSNSAPTLPPPPEGTVDAETAEKSTVVAASATEIDKAADEGRLAIRAADLAPKVIEAMAQKFGPQTVVKKIEELLKATKTMAVGGRPYETPDFKTQLDALKLLLQYQVGMPVSRSEVVTHNVDTMQTLEKKMQGSPALRRAVGRMLDKANIENGERVIEVTPEPSEDELQEAEEVLQQLPEQPETPIQVTVRSRSMRDTLSANGKQGIAEKYGR